MKDTKIKDLITYVIVGCVCVTAVAKIIIEETSKNKVPTQAYAAQINTQNQPLLNENSNPQNQTTKTIATREVQNNTTYYNNSQNTNFDNTASFQHSGSIIINHNNVNAYTIPSSYIQKAKQNFRVFYGHTSHGSQITSGMSAMNQEPFTFNSSGSSGALKYVETSGDLGHAGDLGWASTTRTFLASNPDINVVMWSWCGGCSDNTPQGVNAYLSEMSRLEKEYPKVKFIYMTGHLDGSGTNGNLNKVNQQIRNYCISNNKTLYDFADIESYDPSGNEFLSKGANDGCNYQGRNWAQEWLAKNPNNQYKLPSSAAHTHPLNGAMKGNAFWVLMAKLAGWRG